MYYRIKDNELLDYADFKYADDCLCTDKFTSIDLSGIDEEMTQENKVIVVDGELVLNPNFEAEQEKIKKEMLAQLNLTGADVERGIYRAKGMDFEDILDMVSANPPSGLDVKALKIELKANHFYRGNPYVSAIGKLLGFTEEQLDKFFETNDYKCLLSEGEND